MDLNTILQQFENKVNVIKLKKINVIFQKLIPDARDFISLTALEDRLHSFSKEEAESLQKFFFAFLKQTGKNFMSRRYFHMNLMAAASQNKFGISKMLHDNDVEEIQKSIEALKKSHQQEHNELSENQIGTLNNSYYQKNALNHQISSIHNGSTSTAHSTSRSQNISQNEGVPHIQVTLSISRPMNPDIITTDYQDQQEGGPSFTLSGSTISGIPHNSSSTQISQFEEDHSDNHHHNKSGFNSNRSLAKNMTFNPAHPSMNHNLHDQVLQEIKNSSRQGSTRSTMNEAEMNKKTVIVAASRDNLIKEYKENFQGKENFFHDFLELDNTLKRIERTNQSPTRTLASQADPLVKQSRNNPITDIASLRNLQEIIQIKNGKANQRKPSAPSSILSQVLKQEKGDQIMKKRVGRSVSVNQINSKPKYLSNSPSCEKPTLKKMAPRFLVLKPSDQKKVASRQYSNPEKENKLHGNKSGDRNGKLTKESGFKENILGKRNSEQKLKARNQMDFEQFQQREQLMMNKRQILKCEQPIKTNKHLIVEQTNIKQYDPLSCRQNIQKQNNELIDKSKSQRSAGYYDHYRIKKQLIGKANCQSRRGSNELEAEIGDFFGNHLDDKMVGHQIPFEPVQNCQIESFKDPQLILQHNQLNDVSFKKSNLPLKQQQIIDAPQQGISPTCSTYFEKIIMQDESISKYFTSQNDEDSSPSQAKHIKNQLNLPFSEHQSIPFRLQESQPQNSSKIAQKQETNNQPRRASCVQTTQQWVNELRAESEQTALIQMQMEQLRKIQEAKQRLQAEEEQMIQQLANSAIIKTKPQLVSQFMQAMNQQEPNQQNNANILDKRQSLQSLGIPQTEFSNMNNYVYSGATSQLPSTANNQHNSQNQQFHSQNNIQSYPNNGNQRKNINQYHDLPENTQTTNYQLSSYSSQTSKNENDIQGSIDSGYNYTSHAAQKYTELDNFQCETGARGCYAGDQVQNSSLNFSFVDSQNI